MMDWLTLALAAPFLWTLYWGMRRLRHVLPPSRWQTVVDARGVWQVQTRPWWAPRMMQI